MRTVFARFALAAICFITPQLTVPQVALANMEVAPLVMDLEGGVGEQGSFGVTNTTDTDIPVSIRIVRRQISADGTTEMLPADGEFILFPPQAAIGPLKSQLFRFRYVGEPLEGQSRSYYIYATQLPVDLENQGNDVEGVQARIDFLYEFGISLNLIPEEAAPELIVTRAERSRMPDGAVSAQLTIENRGNRFARIADYELTITAGGQSATFTSAMLRQGLANGFWLPGQSFTIDFPVEGMPAGSLEATLSPTGS
ncbi:MAG: hypothetical protein AAF674_17630 [Pseudomonadota bacterium]